MAPDPNQNFKKTGSIEDESINSLPVFQIAGSSSEEENETENNGYEPLPQGPENLEEDEIDFSSLSTILSALNSHGPNNIDSDEGNILGDSHFHQDILPSQSFHEFTEQGSCNASSTSATQIIIDKDKEEEIKNVMSKITLPKSAIPLWANQLSEEEWKFHVNAIINGHISTDKQDDQR